MKAMQAQIHNRPIQTPWATLVLVITLPILTYAAHRLSPLPPHEVARLFGAVPTQITSGQQIWSLLTSGLLHLSQGHLVSNLFILCFAGSYVERRSGTRRTLLILCLGIVAGALAHVLAYPDSKIPLFGISAGALALSGCAILDAILRKTRPKMQPWILAGGTLLAGLSLIYGLFPALTGGMPMPTDLVESGVAHWVGFGFGLSVGVAYALAHRRDLARTQPHLE